MRHQKRKILAILLIAGGGLLFSKVLRAQQITVQGIISDSSAFVGNGTNAKKTLGISKEQYPKLSAKGLTKSAKFYQSDLPATSKDTGRVGSYYVETGYGIKINKDELTGAVSIFDNTADLSKSMSINPENDLYGRIPGLTVLSNGGLPPTKPTFLIRGKGTFKNNTPLVLVDGFEWYPSTLSPDEIQSVTVLKDAATVAKYGQRGANGVILVTTKHGTDVDGLHVSASYQEGITKPISLPSFVGASDYVNAINEARANDGRDPLYSSADVEAFSSNSSSSYLYPNVNWFDKTLRNHGVRSKFNASFRGGGDRAHYFVLMNLINDNGLFGPVSQNSDYSTQAKYNRFRFRSNLDVNVTKNLLLKLDLGGGIVEQNLPGGGATSQIFNSLYKLPSAAFPVRTPDGSFGGSQTYNSINPVALLSGQGYAQPNSRQFSVMGKIKEDLDSWVSGLSAEADLSFRNYGQVYEANTKSFSYEAVSPTRDVNGNLTGYSQDNYGQDTDLEYSNHFGIERQFADILGKINYKTAVGRDNKFGVSILYHHSSRVFNGQDNTYHRENLVGNVTYSIQGKYFFETTASYSGNNRLPKGNRFVLFPAVSAGWLISKENFFQNASFIDRLKLRASWGISGSDLVPSDDIYNLNYGNATGYRFQDDNTAEGGFAQGRIATPDLTDARSHKTNLGIDATILEKLDFSADFFYDRRTHILTSSGGRVSNVIGFEPPQLTDGVVDNKGFEASVTWHDAIGDWSYHIGGQFSYAHNKIVNKDEQFRQYAYQRRTGHSIGQPFGLVVAGFFKDQGDINISPNQTFSQVEPGDIRYKDQNGDGTINEYDEVPLGYSTSYPEIYFSASLGFGFKGFSVSALLQGTGNYSAMLNTTSVFFPIVNNRTISNYYYNRRWTPETKAIATYPRLTTQSSENNFRTNSLWLTDRSFVKLRNVNISYTFPSSITQKLNLDELLFFARGENLLSIDNIPVLDPENLNSGYPLLRSYSAGLKIAF